MILAIGNSSNYEVNSFLAVQKALRKNGHDAILFKQDQCLSGEFLGFQIIHGGVSFYVAIDGKRYTIDDFSAIWYLKPHLPRELLEETPAEYRHFVERQFLAMRQALWSISRNKYRLNDPWSTQIAENKPYQLVIASQSGFVLPDTLITSDPNEVKQFYQNHQGKIVVKLLATSPIFDHVIYTNKVTPEHLEQIESVCKSPAIFQEIVPKAYELRITVVGNNIFPVKLYSQEDEATTLDWRRKPLTDDFTVKMELTELPLNIKQKIYALMNRLQLRFGCIDMIVTPTGQYVFLEINPEGQWYFVQLNTEEQIAEAIAAMLIAN